MSKWLLIQGSPRVNGTCAKVIRMLNRYLEQERSDVELEIFDIARRDVTGCNGCDFCKDSDGCIIEDDMEYLEEMIDAADRIILATPVYFAGPTSQMKAVIDRLQPYYWKYMARKDEGLPPVEKRPLTLYVVGDGGDPHGHDSLVVCVRSSFAVAGFGIDQIIDLVGKKRLSVRDLKVDHLLQAE